MSEKTFEVGQRVVWTEKSDLTTHDEYEDGNDLARGEVKSINKDGTFSVKLDGTWHKPNPVKLIASALITEVEAEEILSKLEAEFEVWAGPIRKKLKQAGKLLKEAGELADKQGRDLTEMWDITGPLISAMDEIGWRTSSLTC